MHGRIFIVEDDMLIAMLLEDMLADLSYDLAGKAAGLGEAMAMTESLSFDAAILDVSLAGTSSLPVAQRLEEMGKPYLFATGYGSLPDGMAGLNRQILSKPYQLNQLKTALEGLKLAS